MGKRKALQTVGVYIYSCDMNSWTSHIQIKEAEVVEVIGISVRCCLRDRFLHGCVIALTMEWTNIYS